MNSIISTKSFSPGQNDRRFAYVFFSDVFFNVNIRILIEISLKFVPKGLIENKPALVYMVVWRRIGDKPLPKPMLTQFTDAYMWHTGDELKDLRDISLLNEYTYEWIFVLKRAKLEYRHWEHIC